MKIIGNNITHLYYEIVNILLHEWLYLFINYTLYDKHLKDIFKENKLEK